LDGEGSFQLFSKETEKDWESPRARMGICWLKKKESEKKKKRPSSLGEGKNKKALGPSICSEKKRKRGGGGDLIWLKKELFSLLPPRVFFWLQTGEKKKSE